MFGLIDPAELDRMISVPSGLSTLARLQDQPDIPNTELAACLDTNETWRSRVLALASAAWRPGGAQFTNALEVLGHAGPANLLLIGLLAALGQILRRPCPGYDLGEGALLRHGAAVYLALQQLGRLTGRELPEDALAAAWVHDAGKVALGAKIDSVLAAQIRRRQADNGLSQIEAEQECLGTDHAQIGMILLQRWQFPGEIWEMVRRHHDPNPPHETALDTLQLADIVAAQMEKREGSGRRAKIDPELIQRLGLPANAPAQIAVKTEEALRRLEPWLAMV